MEFDKTLLFIYLISLQICCLYAMFVYLSVCLWYCFGSFSLVWEMISIFSFSFLSSVRKILLHFCSYFYPSVLRSFSSDTFRKLKLDGIHLQTIFLDENATTNFKLHSNPFSFCSLKRNVAQRFLLTVTNHINSPLCNIVLCHSCSQMNMAGSSQAAGIWTGRCDILGAR